MSAEILSPCGSFESLEAALRSGADAVYLGGKSFSARANAQNFSHEELETAVALCHRYGARVYQAVNTCVLGKELSSLADELEFSCRTGIDGLIIQDRAVEYIIRTACPDMPIHASTQMTLHTKNGVLWAKEHGYSRAVLSRELPAKTIEELSRLGIETEVFVHGALCMSVSGQCYMSALIGSRSANRGSCAGACRLPFSASGKTDSKYALSLKDMSLADYVQELNECGVSSLKIEGRMKRPEYVAAATTAIKNASIGRPWDHETLKAVFSRSGFTDGYYTGKTGAGMFGARQKEDVLSASGVLPGLRALYRNEPQKFEVSFELSASGGSPCSLTASDGTAKVTLTGAVPQAAVNRETTACEIKAQLSKLGGTLYRLKAASVEIDPGLMLPLSEINRLRREALGLLDEKRIERLDRRREFDRSRLILDRPKTHKGKIPELWVSAQSLSQLSELDISKIPKLILPLSSAEEAAGSGIPLDKIILSLPRFSFDEEALEKRLLKARGMGLRQVECTNAAHIRLAKSLGLSAYGGFGLNITNSVAAHMYASDGLKALTLSFELKASQASGIASPVPVGAVIYGRLPLMLAVNCPIKAELGCHGCTRSVTDRTGAKFPVLCRKADGYVEILNSKVLRLSDKLSDFSLDYCILSFTLETPAEVKSTLDDYLCGRAPQGEYTRGLYYRGII